MRVLYDKQIFTSHARGGIAKYFAQLACFMPSVGWTTVFPFQYSINKHYFEYGGKDLVRIPSGKLGKTACNVINRLVTKRDQEYDIWHSTYYDTSLLNAYESRNMVSTIHDMIPEIFTKQYDSRDWIGKRKYAENSARIISVSHNTKKDICRIYGISEENVAVVHHGIDIDDHREEELRVPDKYLLFVGSRHKYKNFGKLLEAYNIFRKKCKDVSLLCIGVWGFSTEERKRIQELDLRDIYFSRATDLQIRYAMRRAEAFVFPSLYEGFGIPIIEAMQQGCASVVSNASCFPEIARDAGVYFDPMDAESIADALCRVIMDRHFRSERIEIGSVLIKEYDFRKMLRETSDVYKSIL